MSNRGGFALEKDLVYALWRSAATALHVDDRWHRVLREVTVRSRVADCLVVHASTQPVSKPMRMSYFEAAIIAVLLQRGASDIATIADQLFAYTESVESRVSKLIRFGLIDDTGLLLRATGRHLAADVYISAIEAKLTKWWDAIEQAERYLAFANHAFIAMPADVFDRNDDIVAECEGRGIGALAITPDGHVSMIAEPRDTTPQTPEWVRLVSSVVGIAPPLKRAEPGGLVLQGRAPLHILPAEL
jgi:DNA-binding Lrp family transcriptional regulator